MQDWGAHVPVDSKQGGHTAPEVAGLEGTWPRKMQDWREHGPGGCRTDRHQVPNGKRLSGIESSRNGAAGQRAVGYGSGYGVGQ